MTDERHCPVISYLASLVYPGSVEPADIDAGGMRLDKVFTVFWTSPATEELARVGARSLTTGERSVRPVVLDDCGREVSPGNRRVP